jgi:hypothetical protein
MEVDSRNVTAGGVTAANMPAFLIKDLRSSVSISLGCCTVGLLARY